VITPTAAGGKPAAPPPATPARTIPLRSTNPTSSVANVVTRAPDEDLSFGGRLRRNLAEVRSELLKVSWPTRDELRNLTIVVIAITALVGVTLGLLDVLFGEAVRLLTTSGL
jgi:preprotein translocase subunit SecE